MTRLFASVSTRPELSPTVPDHAPAEALPCGNTSQESVSQDADLEQHIRECGEEMQACMARYMASSELVDLADAHRWRMHMEAAIKSRSPEVVAKLEAERGLA